MDRRVSRTKKMIQEAYVGLLMEKKPGKITISEIARRADIDRKTFYLHYDSVEDIIREFCKSKVDELMESLKMEDFPNQSFSIRRTFEILNQIIAKNMEFFWFISVNREYDYFFDQLKDLVVNFIVRNGQGYFGYAERELGVYAEFFISGILSAYTRWLREGMDCSMEELAELVSNATYGGLEKLLPEMLKDGAEHSGIGGLKRD